jgi:predicted N-formylglutamate amidohydrolase
LKSASPGPVVRWLLTCEHGGHEVPARWRRQFRGAREVLHSHRGWDRGALATFRILAPAVADAYFHATTTRLLVDLNRSIGHRALFSEYTRSLPAQEREEILEQHYHAWRDPVIERIDRWRRAGDAVLHVSVHSFTPTLNGQVRNADIGLLYDPGRPWERSVCRRWRQILRDAAPDARVRRNYPYRGSADGFTKTLRRRFPDGYAGIELELNEGNVGVRCHHVAEEILASLRVLRREVPALVDASSESPPA